MASKETESRKAGARDRASRGFSMMTPEEQQQAINDGSVEAQLEAAKRRKLELLEAQRLYQKNHALEFYEPQPQQQAFYDDLLNPNYSVFMLFGGNRSGKSDGAATAGSAFALGRYPWVKPPAKLPPPASIQVRSDGSLLIDGVVYASDKAYKEFVAEQERDKGKLRFNGPIKIRVFGEDFDKAIGQVLLPKFTDKIPPELIASKRKGQTGVYDQFILTNGTVINFMTYQQDPSASEGWDGHVVIFDEPPPRAVWIANARGLVDHNGIAIFSNTPLKEPWMANELASNPAPHIRVYELDSYANPHVEKEALDKFVGLLSPEEKETRTKGKFLHLQGLVFKEFSKATHVIKPFKMPKHWTHYVAIDTHPRTEQALVFVAVDEHDRVHVVHEIFKHGTPDQVAEWITDYHEDVHPIYAAVIEPSSQGDANRGDTTYQIIVKKLSAHSIPVYLGSKDLSSGIQIMREALCSANQQSSLFVFDTCPRLIFEFLNYIWKDWSKATDRNEQQKPRDKDDHLIEDLRRLLQLPVRYVDPRQLNSLLSQANRGYRPRDPIAGV